MNDRERHRTQCRAYRDGWTANPPDNAPARGCILGMFLGMLCWTLSLTAVLWW